MSVSFELINPSTRTILDTEFELNLLSNNAQLVGDAIGLVQYADGDHMAYGGECTAEQLRECLLRWPDGHPDPCIHTQLGVLTKLMTAARRTGHLICWG